MNIIERMGVLPNESSAAPPLWQIQFGRKVWLLVPLVAVLFYGLSPLLDSVFKSVLHLQAVSLPTAEESLTYWLSPRAVLVAVAAAVVVAVGLLLLQFRPSEHWPIAAVTSVVVVLVVNAVMQMPFAERRFLVALEARLEAESFDRQITRWHRDKLIFQQTPKTLPRVAIVGQSQIEHALPVHAVRATLEKAGVAVDVLGRTFPGMPVTAYPAVAGELQKLRPDLVICWLSEIDTDRQTSLTTNRIRSVMSLQGAADVTASLSLAQIWEMRSQVIDIYAAAAIGLWSFRDLSLRLIVDFWGADAFAGAGEQINTHIVPKPEVVRQGIKDSMEANTMAGANLLVLERFFKRVTERGAELWVIEGENAPSAVQVYDPTGERRQRVTSWLNQQSKTYGFRVVGKGQRPVFNESDFRDPTHVGETGRDKMVSWLLAELKQKSFSN